MKSIICKVSRIVKSFSNSVYDGIYLVVCPLPEEDSLDLFDCCEECSFYFPVGTRFFDILSSVHHLDLVSLIFDTSFARRYVLVDIIPSRVFYDY